MFKFMMSLLICLIIPPLPLLADGKSDGLTAEQAHFCHLSFP